MHFSERKYKCLIVDDNNIDRLTTASFIRKYPFLQIEGSFDNPSDAGNAADKNRPDVMFLDIDMPDLTGLDLRARLDKVPACIFITAFPDYALSAFEVNALDFIVKPIDEIRFQKAMERLHYFLSRYFQIELQEHRIDSDELFIKEGHEHIRLRYSDIVYLEALKDYTGIITKDRKYCVLAPLGNLLKEKAFLPFVRIHRSYAVQKKMIDKVTPAEVVVGKVFLPLGRTYRENLNGLIS